MPASESQGLAHEESALRLPQTRFKAHQTGLTARAGRLSLRTSSPGDRRLGAWTPLHTPTWDAEGLVLSWHADRSEADPEGPIAGGVRFTRA
jgi:hypothetical protein